MYRKLLQLRRSPATVAFCLSLAALAMSGAAHAGCAIGSPSTTRSVDGMLTPAVYRPGDGAQAMLLTVSDDELDVPIVGLWKFQMFAESTPTHTNPMPNGTLIDFGTVAWHADHTELMNSGSRNPGDGDFCQGVWKQVAARTFALNHLALAWTSGSYTGPGHFHEYVTVDATGMTYTGTFTLVQYLATPTPNHEFDETTPLVTITGIIKATRMTAN